ncbi:MAG: protein-L-isoaspartate(D-aspartate) O-methyltransferase [Bacteroidales bacterium]|jgi:protein-L-isoaspartate(D-aspartate) O-methyltransferase|nr:protein-L-isoaspartate(D-aspartate) O-methyltransferase [Bacteroidales bacterium]MCU0410243.1 protein-L-isoaspartate(D-aspartate) O-methyltransferase [Bacteroidales bacterium]
MKQLTVILLILASALHAQKKDKYESARLKMVDSQIAARGISDAATLRAMRTVPRHLFVLPEDEKEAYSDRPLPIGYGQTISQPLIVAYMTELSRPAKGKKALEIGTGSGYQAAVLAEIIDTVYTIEIVPELAWEATARLKILEYQNIVTKYGDGYKGWPEHAPFDIIIVTAAADHIPEPLKEQLAENGRLVMPVGDPAKVQELILLTKKKGKITETVLEPVRFVPLKRLK